MIATTRAMTPVTTTTSVISGVIAVMITEASVLRKTTVRSIPLRKVVDVATTKKTTPKH